MSPSPKAGGESRESPSLVPLLVGLGAVACLLALAIAVLLIRRASQDATPSPTPSARASPLPSATPLPPIPADFVQRAQALLDRGDVHALRAYTAPYLKADEPVALLYAGFARLKASPPDLSGIPLLERSAEQGIGDAAYALARWYRPLGEEGAAKAFRWASRGAELDQPLAMTLLGELYLTGAGTPKDTAKALDWLRQGAAAQDFQAMTMLGLLFSEGRYGVELDIPRGLRWFEQAAELGEPIACHTLGHRLLWGLDREPSAEELAQARALLERGATAGDKSSLADLGWLSFRGLGMTRDEVAGLAMIQKSADADVLEAIYLLGRIYWRGHGEVGADPALATRLFRRGAELGSGDCAHKLAQAYEEGEGGLAKDGEEAIRFYERAAELRHAAASLSLAMHLLTGQYRDPDPKRAAKLLEFAASHGEPRAAVSLAGLLHSGKEIPNDRPRAYRLYLQAARQRDLDGIANAARVLDRGAGGPRDRREALRWARVGAERNHARSMFMLGTLLYEGRPEIPKNVTEGRKWLLAAAKGDDRMAKAYLQRRGIR